MIQYETSSTASNQAAPASPGSFRAAQPQKNSAATTLRSPLVPERRRHSQSLPSRSKAVPGPFVRQSGWRDVHQTLNSVANEPTFLISAQKVGFLAFWIQSPMRWGRFFAPSLVAPSNPNPSSNLTQLERSVSHSNPRAVEWKTCREVVAQVGAVGASTRVEFESCELAPLTVREVDTDFWGSWLPVFLFFDWGPTDVAFPLRFPARFADSSASRTCISGTEVDPGGKAADVRDFGCKEVVGKRGGGQRLRVELLVTAGLSLWAFRQGSEGAAWLESSTLLARDAVPSA